MLVKILGYLILGMIYGLLWGDYDIRPKRLKRYVDEYTVATVFWVIIGFPIFIVLDIIDLLVIVIKQTIGMIRGKGL